MQHEKKKIMGTNKHGPFISKTVVPPSPGDDPKHELVALQIRRDTTTSPDPEWNDTEQIIYEQVDGVAGTGTARGIMYGFTKMETQTTGHSKERLKQLSKKMVLGK
jgi:hypothetical protein